MENSKIINFVRRINMKKYISIILVLSLIMLSLAGCTQTPQSDVNESSENNGNQENQEIEETTDKGEESVDEKVNLKAVVLSGPTAITMAKLFKDEPEFKEADIDYEIINAPDLMTARLLSGEADFAVISTNLGAKLYNNGKDKFNYKLAVSSVWGVLYIISSEEIGSWEDLKGKDVVTIGKGLTPDMVFRYLAQENGLNPDEDLNIEYLPSPQELAQTMISGKSKTAIMPQPLLSAVLMKNKDVKVALDLQNEWEKTTGLQSYPQSSLIIKNDVIDKYPELVNDFLDKYKESIEWTNENPSEAGTVVEGLDIGLSAKIAEMAIPGSNLRFVNASEARGAIDEYLEVLKNFSPESIGGELPSDEFYMER